MLNELPGKEIKTMMDVANVQDSRMAGVLLEPFESPVAFAQARQLNDGFGMEPIPLTRTARNDVNPPATTGMAPRTMPPMTTPPGTTTAPSTMPSTTGQAR